MTVPIEIARELRYELAMAEYTHKQLLEGFGQMEVGTSSAFVESFIAHARILDEFLGGRQREPRRDDVTARSLSAEWAGVGFLSEEDRTRTDKQLLHLTRARSVRERWPLIAIARALASTYLAFYNTLDEADRYELEGTKNSARAMLEQCDASHSHELRLGLVWANRSEADSPASAKDQKRPDTIH